MIESLASIIELDSANQPVAPEIILAFRNGNKQGVVLNVPNDSVHMGFHLNEADEISFDVYKTVDGVECSNWESIRDFKFIYLPYYDRWYQITVSVDENDKTIKHVSGYSVCESELSQIILDEVEINTEDDISRDDYEDTILYDPENPNASLLDRILKDKCSHYSIHHVDESIAREYRMFSWDNTPIYDALGEIAEEIQCLFVFGEHDTADQNIHRTISAYDLLEYCRDCCYRAPIANGVCPKCGSKRIVPGYGKETNLFISSENFGEELNYNVNTDNVKNCFKLVGGDDDMTAAIRNCNPSGSQYIWYFSDDMLNEMSESLRDKLIEYFNLYKNYRFEKEYVPDANELAQYNELIEKYQKYDDTLSPIESPIVGYTELTGKKYEAWKFYSYLNTSLLPAADGAKTTTAEEQADLITNENMSPIGVENLRTLSSATANTEVCDYAKVYIDTSRYSISVSSSEYNSTTRTWTGTLNLTSYSDENDTADTDSLTIVFNNDATTHIKQRIDKAMKKNAVDSVGIVALFKKKLTEFNEAIKEYSLDGLNVLYSASGAAIDIMVEMGISSPSSDLYNELYVPHVERRSSIEQEMELRESEAAAVDLLIGWFDEIGQEARTALDIKAYLGEQLWVELASFRRDDIYENSNYISDGLSDDELISRATAFYERAQDELITAATLQHTISGSFVDFLMVLKTSDQNFDYDIQWDLGNWLHIEVDGNVYRLRMVDYEIDFGSIDDLGVTFSDVVNSQHYMSDVKSILNSASSMATNYPYTVRQAGSATRTAKVAIADAAYARRLANDAEEDAARAKQAADSATSSAERAREKADQASDSAYDANIYANQALDHLSTVQDVVGVFDWMSKHGEYKLTVDEVVDTNKFYFERVNPSDSIELISTSLGDDVYGVEITDIDVFNECINTLSDSDTSLKFSANMTIVRGSELIVIKWSTFVAQHDSEGYPIMNMVFVTESQLGIKVDYNHSKYAKNLSFTLNISRTPNYEYSLVTNPTGNPKEQGWFELENIEDTMGRYIQTHVALTDRGLWLQTTEDKNSSKLLVSPTEGVLMYGINGQIIAKYGETAQIGELTGFHIQIDGTELGFYDGSAKVAYVSNNTLYIAQSVVLNEMQLGENKWTWKLDPHNDGIYLKWIGG